MKLERVPSQEQIPAYINRFSKLADFKAPDSPPPQKEPEDPHGPNSFEQLMKAACSIKQGELESRRRKFERLPAFLKAGVYYTNKLECTRQQAYFPRLFAFEAIMVAANKLYAKKEFESAARKYEEAYSCWRYFLSKNPNWANEGIDDTQLTEVEWLSANKWENDQVLKHKITVLLNISSCLMKVKNWQDAVACLNEILRLDPTNNTALYRRSKALSKPINSSVEDFKKAVKDLKALNSNEVRVLRRIAKLEQKIKHNSKCEQEVYSKMFTRTSA
jgi:tetratricopeptide (TPR) repeat protein